MKRIHNLGNYSNIELFDGIENIPEQLVFDTTFVNKARYLMLVQSELIYQMYQTILAREDGLTPQEAIKMLSEEKTKLTEEINKTLEDIKND